MMILVHLCVILTMSRAVANSITGLTVRHNVILKEISEISLSRSSWTVSLYVDLNSYNLLLTDITELMKMIHEAMYDTMNHHLDEQDYAHRFMDFYVLLSDDILTFPDRSYVNFLGIT